MAPNLLFGVCYCYFMNFRTAYGPSVVWDEMVPLFGLLDFIREIYSGGPRVTGGGVGSLK